MGGLAAGEAAGAQKAVNLYQLRAFSLVQNDDPMHRVVKDAREFEQAIRFLRDQPQVAVDTETSGLAWMRHAGACGVSMAAQTDRGPQCFYFPFAHQTYEPQLRQDMVVAGIRDVLEDQRITKILHNIKFDEHMFKKLGLRILGPRRDTSIEGHLLDENSPIALKERAAIDLRDTRAFVFDDLLDAEVTRLAKEAGLGKNEFRDRYGYARVDVDLCGRYAAWDVDFTLRLADHYDAKGVRTFFRRLYQTEMQLTKVLFEMEENGVPLNAEYLMWLKGAMEQEQDRIRPQLFAALGGYVFNPGSDDEVRDILTKKLGLKLWKTTDGGVLSVDVEVLAHFAKEHPFCALMMRFREAEKIRATYTDSLLKFVGYDGLLHGSFKQMGTNTGRLSAGSPNMQNFAGDSDDRAKEHSGKSLENGGQDPWSVKRAFTNRSPEHMRLYFDYSQIELRVLAFYSQDPVMRDVYLRGEDIHTRTSLEVFGTAEKAMRRKAKVINFGLMYLMSAKGYGRQAGVDEEQAEKDMARYFEKFPRVKAFRGELFARMRAENPPCFVNLFGRCRRIPGLREQSRNPDFATREERQAIGSYVQGTAAELTKESLVRIWEWEQVNRSGLLLCQTIHDEVAMDAPRKYGRDITRAVVRMMEDFPQFAPIPITTDAEYSTTDWSEKKKLPKEWVH